MLTEPHGTLTRGLAKKSALLDSRETGPINCGTEHEITMLELARTVVRLAGSGSEITYLPRMPDDPDMRRPDLTRARTLLGYEPTVSPEDGLRRTIANFAERLGPQSRR